MRTHCDPFTGETLSAINRASLLRKESNDIANSTFPPSPLIHAFDDQDQVFAAAFAILQEGIAQQAFPAASAAVTQKRNLVALKSFGTFVFRDDEIAPGGLRENLEVRASTLFDLASLTKVVATTSMAMLLYERGLLDLETPIAAVVPDFVADTEKDTRRREVTFRQILAHSSGLPAYEKLFLKNKTRDQLLHSALTTPLVGDPGVHAKYSDIGFIILGLALERLADERLDSFCQREIFAPLAMARTGFNPPADIRNQIPPTANDREFRARIIQGEVQDENASVLGGVAGHAGVFSPALDLGQFAHCILNPERSIFRPETVALFTRREASPSGTSRALGWDTPTSPSQSGQYFSPEAFGHLGYTGTSLWIDRVRQVSVTLLTNRTWPDCSNQAIKQIRPRFHNAVLESLGFGS